MSMRKKPGPKNFRRKEDSLHPSVQTVPKWSKNVWKIPSRVDSSPCLFSLDYHPFPCGLFVLVLPTISASDYLAHQGGVKRISGLIPGETCGVACSTSTCSSRVGFTYTEHF
uniref:(California timema) hypothetical protein n=1 Tax=Timema californicum TaxID=61474 RepID=A0A7R9JFC8_TIMCA|nr:unnamed protein product [Timema californicum]